MREPAFFFKFVLFTSSEDGKDLQQEHYFNTLHSFGGNMHKIAEKDHFSKIR